MTKDEFKNLKVGTIVRVTKQGVNYGKLGVVKVIAIDPEDWKGLPLLARGERVYLKPIDCVFEFSDQSQGLKKRGDSYAFKPRYISHI